MSTKSISETHKQKQNQNGARGCLGLFGLVFGLFGIGFLVFGVIIPTMQSKAAQDWPTAPCEILAAEWQEHRGEDSTSYSIDFKYEFNVDGQRYEGTRFSFANTSGQKSEAKRQRKLFPAGSKRSCFYNPKDPSDCVLDRDNSDLDGRWMMWFVPVLFALVGFTILATAIFGWGFKKGNSISGDVAGSRSISSSPTTLTGNSLLSENAPSATLPADALDHQWSEPRKLKPTNSRLGALFICLIFGGFWNGILSLFLFNGELFQALNWSSILFGLFLVPFVLVGLLLIAGAFYSFIALFNPVIEIAFSSAAVPLGGNVDIAWEVQGKAERISKLSIEIHGQQTATYRRGTDTITDTEIFEIIPLATVTDFQEIAFGSQTIEIPMDTMHTFEGDNNSIKWQVVVLGDIAWSPDIYETYEFRVTPQIVTTNQ
jgi:hypothetical protein